MKKHKWHDEIVAWASGAEIEVRISDSNHAYVWTDCETPMFDTNEKWEYRIKPQPKEDWVMICKRCGDEIGIVCEPKEPQYLYAYYLMQKPEVFLFDRLQIIQRGDKFLGKIKLEDE